MELLDTFTTAPPAGAAPASVSVAVEDWPPLTVPGLRVKDCRLGGAFAIVNVAVMTSVPPAESVILCVMVCVPLATCSVFQGWAAEVDELFTLPAKS